MAKQPKKKTAEVEEVVTAETPVEAVEATTPVRPAHVVPVKDGTGASKTRTVDKKATVAPKGVKTR